MANNVLTYWEHCGANRKYPVFLREMEVALLRKAHPYQKTFRKLHKGKVSDLPCFTIEKHETNGDEKLEIKTGYFIGVDWLDTNDTALYVAPKLNSTSQEIDFVKMLFSALRHPDVMDKVDQLFEVKWDLPPVQIEQKQDLLTPLLVVEFLSLLKVIVRKGLKKSYYKVEKNLNSRIKGKILVGKNLKTNVVKNRVLNTYCQFEEFGINNKENQLLKKALVFVKSYLPTYSKLTGELQLQDLFNYINPAFAKVDPEIDLNSIKQTKYNPFYKEYSHATRLAKLILRRFGYNISNTGDKEVKTPPFWIDMSKLFELYVLGLLKDRFQKQVKYQFSTYGNELDFLLNSDEYKMVIDAKYIPRWKDNPLHDNLRQVSGYARLERVYNTLGKTYPDSIDCLVIYPEKNNRKDLKNLPLNDEPFKVPKYFGVYQIGVELPMIGIP